MDKAMTIGTEHINCGTKNLGFLCPLLNAKGFLTGI